MSERVKAYLILVTTSFIVMIFVFSAFYFRSKFVHYKRDVESDLARISLFYLKSDLHSFGKRISDFLKNEDISISNLESLGRKMCEDCSFAIWMDIDGNSVSEFGNVPSEDFYNDALIQALLYEESYAFLSDLYFLDDAVQIRTAMVVKTINGDDLIVLVGKTLPADYFAKIGHLIHRKVFFISKDGKVFGEGFQVSADLLKKAAGGQRPETEITKDGELVIAVPFFDFEEWGIKGFLINSIEFREVQKAFLKFLIIDIFLFSASFVILIFGILSTVRKKLKVMSVLFFYSLPLLFSILFVFVFQMPKVLETEYIECTEAMSKVLKRFGKIWLETTQFDEMKKMLNVQILLIENRNIVSSTLKKNVLSTLANWMKLRNIDTVEIGELDVNKVRYTYLGLKQESEVLFLLKEKTPLVNNVVNIKFMGIVMIMVSFILVLILGFSIKNTDHPRFLKATLVGYIFLAPALIHLLWWAAGPVAFSFYLAFHRWNVIDPAKPFVGFENFKELFQDKLFWNAMKNTVIFSLQVPISMLLSLFLAIAVNRQTKSMALLRTVYYLPAVTAGVSTTIVWRWILNKEFGILNYVLGFFGIPKIPWLTSPNTALIAIMLMTIWQSLGSQMIIFLAGLQSIPQAFYEAASIDGANAFQKFRFITIPLLKPTTVFVLVTSVIGSFQVFTPIYVLTQGGPLRSTDVVFYHIWESAWIELKMGYAAAQSWMLFLVLLVLTYVEFKLFGKESWKQYF
ncbi:carbohydrate ABC transporter permease [Pseudothermotoga sp.]|nr:sugar ABC transporter permease [Pseudothermotoga sp.]MDW8139943.1 sugar ABC transporter permease [Pseudothermotoga sp.]